MHARARLGAPTALAIVVSAPASLAQYHLGGYGDEQSSTSIYQYQLDSRELLPDLANPLRCAIGNLDYDARVDAVVYKNPPTGNGEAASELIFVELSAPMVFDESHRLSLPIGGELDALAVADLNGNRFVVAGRNGLAHANGGHPSLLFVRALADDDYGVVSEIVLDVARPGFRDVEYIETGDVDLDGDLELVVALAAMGEGPYGVQVVVVDVDADGSVSLRNLHTEPSVRHLHLTGFELGDVDGDGDLDVLFALRGQGMHFLLNQGRGDVIAREIPIPGLPPTAELWAINLVELVGDGGAPEIVAGFGRTYVDSTGNGFHGDTRILDFDAVAGTLEVVFTTPVLRNMGGRAAIIPTENGKHRVLSMTKCGQGIEIDYERGEFRSYGMFHLPEWVFTAVDLGAIDADLDGERDEVFIMEWMPPVPNARQAGFSIYAKDSLQGASKTAER